MSSPKNVLLINPWIYDFTAYDFWLRPLGFLTVAAVLRENADCRLRLVNCLDRGHPRLGSRRRSRPDGRGPFPKTEVVKPGPLRNVPRRYSRYGIPEEAFLDDLDRSPRPDVVLMTCMMTYWYPGVQRACRLVREKWGSVPIVLGGLYATLAPEHARSQSGADVVVEGPGENRILPVLRDILGDGTVRPREYGSLEELPVPAFELLESRETLPLLTSRGCPFRCSFCGTPVLFSRLEQRSPRSVIAEVADDILRWGARNIAFYDDALLANKKSHIIPILEGVAERALPVSFHTPNGLHVREVDGRLASLFRRAGVRSVYLSQESFDRPLLDRACPKVSPDDLGTALSHLRAAGYAREDINVYLIVGLPRQDAALVCEGIRAVRRLGAKPRLAFFSPVPGTEEWRRTVASGRLPENADPLLHNKLAFAYLWGDSERRSFEAYKSALTESL
jgi:radical SAM superfamily enzyme YgiQ (UPF0313 family)